MQPLLRWQVISDGDEGPRQQGANLASHAATGGTAMAFKVGDAVRLKSGGAQMIVSKLFKSPEGREMVQCTWFDKKTKRAPGCIRDGFLGSRGSDKTAPQAKRTRLRLCSPSTLNEIVSSAPV
jgi:uncharacterized protein YodC (DUF2158 family)